MSRINAVAFICVMLILISGQFFLKSSYLTIFTKPWHMQPFADEDKLSDKLLHQYEFLDAKQVHDSFLDSGKTLVSILVDAWGVPLDESLLKKDIDIFQKNAKVLALRRRKLNQTMHAERMEFRSQMPASIYLFGGDSTEYNRKEYIPDVGFSQMLFCQGSPDSAMIGKLDSLLSMGDSLERRKFLGLTTQSSRDGNRDSLHSTLTRIANLAAKHPDVVFVVQGTHRPILGTPETRKMYYAHWVPVVVINAKELGK